jgi:hypothetical protein
MALGDLHVFTGEEYVDTELAPLLNENFNSLKEYVDDASRWQVMPVQFKGTNAKFLIHETTLGTGTTQVLPLVVLDNTDIAKFSACSLKVVMSTKNGSIAAVNCDISLQKVHNSNECNVNFNTTNSDDAKAEPCTFTYNNIKYAGLKLTTGNADTLWVSGYTTEEWIAPVVNTSVTNLVTLGSDMNVIPTLFKSLQTDKSPVNDYDVVNKKSLNDLTNIKTYVDTGYWQPNETVTRDTVRKLVGKQYAGCFLVCKVAGTTGSTQPSPDPADGAGIGGGSGSITFYSSLEEIGITPGEETFASIHSALPMNSTLEYYADVNSNFNDDMYPVKNYYGILQAVKLDSIKTFFSFYQQNIVSGNQFSELYLSVYDSYFSDSRTTVWKKVALDSDLTTLSNSLTNLKNSLGNAAYSTLLDQPDFPNNSFANKIPVVRADGVMEVGQYIDFHIADSSNYDWDVRLEATKNGLYINTPSGGGGFGYWTISKGTNGWARESSTGFTIQWGTFTVSSDRANPVITCPISFSSTNYIVAFTQETGNASLWSDAHITYVSNSQFRWYSGRGTWKYLAIGY